MSLSSNLFAAKKNQKTTHTPQIKHNKIKPKTTKNNQQQQKANKANPQKLKTKSKTKTNH